MVRRRTKLAGGELVNLLGRRKVFAKKELYQAEMLAKLGATDAQLAIFFDVSQVTIEDWGRKFPEFRKARKKGGMEADMKVAQSLYRRATGFSYIETEFTAVTDPVTGLKMPLEQMAMVKKIKKHMPGDTKAALAWLKSRQKEAWTFVAQYQHSVSGKVEHIHKKLQEIPVNELTPEAQQLLLEIADKQITSGQRDN